MVALQLTAHGLEAVDLQDGRLVIAPFDTFGNRVRALLYNARYTGRGLQRLHHMFAPPNAVEETARLMEIARGISEARGARFAWLFLPHPRECVTDAYRVDLTGLVFPDMRPFFPRDAESVARIQLTGDPHWNGQGHALAARAVAASGLQFLMVTRPSSRLPFEYS